MINGFWNGLSGISVQEKALDTESNNISNVNTTAHKSDRISFSDLMYSQGGYGYGAATQTVEKNFKQGDIKATGNNFDVAIEGKGFFIVKDTNTSDVYYTRAGNFQMDSNGFLVTAEQMRVQGVISGAPTVVSSDPAVTSFNVSYTNLLSTKSVVTDTIATTINARSTNFVQSAKSSGVSGQGYKEAGSKVADIEVLTANYKDKLNLYSTNPAASSTPGTAMVTEIPYTNFLNFLNDQNDVIKLTVDGNILKQNFDTNVQTTMNKFADKISQLQGLTASVDTNGVLKITSLIPGKDVKITDPAINNHAPSINQITAPSSGSGLGMINSARDALKTALEAADAKFLELTNSVNLPNGTGIVAQDIQLKPTSLNFSDSNFGRLEVEDGKIFIFDGDNKYVVGAFSTAAFNNEHTLHPEGGNLFSTAIGTSTPIDASQFNSIVSTSLELSNSKFAENLSNMLVYQRAFDANSKSLTTSDDLLKTAIQLKK